MDHDRPLKICEPKGSTGKVKDDRQHIFNVYIFNQLIDLAGRINNVGGIDAIQIATSLPEYKNSVRLDAEFKNYINSIKDEVAYGPLREITGRVVDLLPAEGAVKIVRQPEGVVKVMLSPEDFRAVRYSNVKDPLIRVTGEPIYRLGVETYHYEAFNAHTVTIVIEPSDKSQLAYPIVE